MSTMLVAPAKPNSCSTCGGHGEVLRMGYSYYTWREACPDCPQSEPEPKKDPVSAMFFDMARDLNRALVGGKPLASVQVEYAARISTHYSNAAK